MALAITLMEGGRVEIGDAVVEVVQARRGRARLAITAPRSVNIRRIKADKEAEAGKPSEPASPRVEVPTEAATKHPGGAA